MGILTEAESSDHEYFLPSWVPEWKAPMYHGFWSNITPAGHKAAGDSVISLIGRAKSHSIAPYIQDVNPKVVKQAHSRLTLAETLAFSKLPLGHRINESSSIAARCQRYAEGYFRENAYCRTLVGDNRSCVHQHESMRPRGGKNEPSITDKETVCFFSHFRQILTIICPGGVINNAECSRLSPMLFPLRHGFHVFWETMVNVAEGRRFFATLGGYMGLGPPGKRPGDLICVFLGAPVPWVIRQERQGIRSDRARRMLCTRMYETAR
ncbi:hypothetical protein MMC22_004598 [Lobaria immixta]|nr:hypothetical protein [Lobaria immixta]